MRLSEAIEQYYLTCKVNNISKSTMNGYVYHLSRFLNLVGDMPIEQLSAVHIRLFIAHEMDRNNKRTGEPLSSESVKKAYLVLSAFSRWATAERLIEECPTERTRPPRVESDLPEALTHEELVRIFDYLDTRPFRDKVIFEFFLDTGCRLNEVSGLTLDDIYLTEGFAKVFGKGRREGIVPLGRNLTRDLHTYINRHRRSTPDERALFVSTVAPYKGLTRDGLSTLIKRVHKHCGIEGKYGAHKLRHTMATQFIINGGDIAILRRILRHSNIAITQRYINLVQGDVQEAHQRHSPLDQLQASRRQADGSD